MSLGAYDSNLSGHRRQGTIAYDSLPEDKDLNKEYSYGEEIWLPGVTIGINESRKNCTVPRNPLISTRPKNGRAPLNWEG